MRHTDKANLSALVGLLCGLLLGVGAGNLVAADTVPAGAQAIRMPEAKRSPFLSAVYSPSGASLLSGHCDNRICLWDAKSGKLRKEIEAPDESVVAVAFAPDGATFASGGMEGRLDLWETATGQRRRSFVGHQGSVAALAFSPDGKRLASGGKDKLVRLWEVDSGRLLAQWSGHEGSLTFVGFAANGGKVVSGSTDGTIRLWDVKTGKETTRLEGTSQMLALSADGRLLAYATAPAKTAGQWTLHIRDVVTGEQIREIELGTSFAPWLCHPMAPCWLRPVG
jgi:WD40 repeat protein